MYLLLDVANTSFNSSAGGAYYMSLLLSLLENPDASKNVTLLTLRCICNLSKSNAGEAVFSNRRNDILDKV